MGEWISDEEWVTIVQNIPIVSVDLLVRAGDGIVLGKRINEPAKGEWFIPGGRVYKGETRMEAVHRIGTEELGIEVEIVESLGAFEHIYQASDIDGVDTKHYLANGYVVDPGSEQFRANEQHADFRMFESAPSSLHQHVRAYIEASETVDF